MKELKTLLKNQKTQVKESHPGLSLELNTLIVKFNKHYAEIATVADADVK